MGGYSQGRPSWMNADFFPVQERLVKGAKSEVDAAFIVDIGGSVGHHLVDFARKHSDTPGRLVLQDLPAVLGQIESLDNKIERMAYDFYTERPLLSERLPSRIRRSPHSNIDHRCSCILYAFGALRLAEWCLRAHPREHEECDGA